MAAAALSTVKALWKEVQKTSIDLDVLSQLIPKIYSESGAFPVHKLDVVRKTIEASQKSIRRQKRTASEGEKEQYERLSQQLGDISRSCDEKESSEVTLCDVTDRVDAADKETGLPTSVSAYLNRLKYQKKELYKDPPVLPPPKVTIEPKYVSKPPTRHNKTGELIFTPGTDESAAFLKMLKEFRPNLTPEQVLRGGAFGGTYFRAIDSAVTGKRYTADQALADTVPDEWITGLNKASVLTSQTYRTEVNKYKVKCGGSLGMWERYVRLLRACTLAFFLQC